MAAQRNVLVMVAMEEEAQYLKPYLENPTEVTLRGIPYAVLRGTIKGVQVDIVVSGIGAVYAASATSAALLQTTPDCVLSVGCSGAHQPGQGVGDVVLGSEVVPLDPVVVEHQATWAETHQRCRDPACGKLCYSYCPGCAKADDCGPSSGFYCHGKGRDCLGDHHRKRARTKA